MVDEELDARVAVRVDVEAPGPLPPQRRPPRHRAYTAAPSTTVNPTSGALVLLGRVVVDTIVQKINGEEVEKEAYLVPFEVTKDNLDSFDRSILYPPQ